MTVSNIALDCFGILITLIMLFCCIGEEKTKNKQFNIFIMILFCNAVVLVCDALTWLLDDNPAMSLLLYVLNFIVFSLGYVMASLFTRYMLLYIPQKNKALHYIAIILNVICLISIILVVISMFNHMYFRIENGIYQRGPLFWLSQVLSIVVVLTDLIVVLCLSKKIGVSNAVALLTYGIFPIIATIIQLNYYGVTLIYVATTLSLFTVYTVIHAEQNRKRQQLENELTQNRIAIMLSQIQPHFLYNSLGVIQDLCHGKAPEAEQATMEFTEFLRCNVDSLNADKPIPFEKELKHTQNYLYLESIRFGDRLKIEWNIETKNFSIPALTLQPVVENAVRYGIMKRENGGIIKISSFEDESEYVITVQDDGIGFDINSEQKNDRLHIGISNVKSRIKSMCGGDFVIESKPGVGTVAKLILPKEGGRK